MDAELITLASSALTAAAAALASATFRGLLRSIFRRPRETSIIVERGGKRVEVTGATAEEAHAAVVKLLAEQTEESVVTSGGNDRSGDRSQSASTVTGGETNG